MATESSLALLERFRDLAHGFRRAAHEGDLETMEDLLEQRRAIAEGLARAGNAPSEAERTERTDVVEAILAMDRDAEEALRAHQTEIGGALKELSEGRRGLTGYGASAGRAGKWIDERR